MCNNQDPLLPFCGHPASEIEAVQPRPFKSERQTVAMTFMWVYFGAHERNRMFEPI
jgi:hypothetical protein